MKHVFISYRRSDSLHVAGRLYDRLSMQMQTGLVFRDVDSIPMGTDFQHMLEEEVARCDVFIVVIADRWLSAHDAGGRRRLDDPNDFVRIEIEAALDRDVPILIALVDDAPMPAAESLPPSLGRLTSRPVLPLRADPLFRSDVARLLEAVGAVKLAGRRLLTAQERWSLTLALALRRASSESSRASFWGVCFWRGRFSSKTRTPPILPRCREFSSSSTVQPG